MTQSHEALSKQARKIRRDNVFSLLSTGYTNHRDIADRLNVSVRTVDRDANYLIQVSDEDMHLHFKNLPLEIKKGIGLAELTIRELTEFMAEVKDTDRDQWLEASRDRLHADEYRQQCLDGKAQLREAFRHMDSTTNRTLDLTGKNIKVLKDGSIPKHS